MKLVIAVHHFLPRYTGGGEGYAYRMAASLQARGHEVSIVCVEHIDADTRFGAVSWEDDVYHGLPVRRLSFNLSAAPDPVRWEYDNPWIGDHLRQFLSERQPDVFHLVSGYLMTGRALREAQQLGLLTVVTLTDFWFLCRRVTMLRSDGRISALPINPVTCARCLGEEQRRYRWPGRLAPGLMNAYWRRQKTRIGHVEARQDFLRQTLDQVNAIISPSEFLRSIFVETGVSPERIIFLRHGRDLAHLTPELLEKKPGDVLRVGYLGQITWHKGVHVLVEAAQHMPEARMAVKVYGDPTPFPDYTARLRQMMAGDRRLQLAGVYRSVQEMSAIYRELDVIVVPSVWYENCPTVILEAFAHRTPVIASNLGGMAELVRNGENGLLFAPGDSADLARQLHRLLDEPGLLTALRAGIGPVKSVAQEVDELETIYRRVAR